MVSGNLSCELVDRNGGVPGYSTSSTLSRTSGRDIRPSFCSCSTSPTTEGNSRRGPSTSPETRSTRDFTCHFHGLGPSVRFTGPSYSIRGGTPHPPSVQRKVFPFRTRNLYFQFRGDGHPETGLMKVRHLRPGVLR